MKSLKISRTLRERIRDVAYPKESVDATLHRLIVEYGEEIKNTEETNQFININVDNITHKELVMLKSGNDTIVRVIEKLVNASENDKGDNMVIVDGKKFTLDEFKSDVLDKMNVVVGGVDYDVLGMCTPSGTVIGTAKLEFESDDDKSEFVSLMQELGYI
jgi:hypothetical protein